MIRASNDENDSGVINRQIRPYRPANSSRSKSKDSATSPSDGSRKLSKEKPPQKFKNRELALKYKVEADQIRKKKFGIEPPRMVHQPEEAAYSTIMSSKQDDSRETPNFSMALSKRDIHDEDEEQATLVSSPDRV